MEQAVWIHFITTASIWAYKIAILVLGYLFVRLGYSLFIKGVTGEFKFGAEFKGAKTHLISASPGLFLILMGTIVVGIGLLKGMSIEATVPIENECTPYQTEESQPFREQKPPLPIRPPQEGG